MASYHTTDISTPLTHAEREVVLTIADDEKHWTVFTDSRRAASTRFLKVARALGISPVRVGHGWEFTLPLKAVRVAAPRKATLAQREAGRRGYEASLGSKSRRNGPVRRHVSAPPGPGEGSGVGKA